jgi:MAternally affected uncoordination
LPNLEHLFFQWFQSQKLPQMDQDVCFESASALASIFEAQGQGNNVKQVLQRAVELSRGSPYWHCRLLFQLAVS